MFQEEVNEGECMIKVIENLGLNNQNIFKIMKVVDSDKFKDFVEDFDESTLSSDICDAVNNIAGSVRVCIPDFDEDSQICVNINNKKIKIKDKESFCNQIINVNLNQSFEIQNYLQDECSIKWLDYEED